MMEIGMMWYCSETKEDFATRLDRAVQYYKDKYKETPNMCFVNPEMDFNGSKEIDGVKINTLIPIPINCFWIGCVDAS